MLIHQLRLKCEVCEAISDPLTDSSWKYTSLVIAPNAKYPDGWIAKTVMFPPQVVHFCSEKHLGQWARKNKDVVFTA
jgi:hypothetical protein